MVPPTVGWTLPYQDNATQTFIDHIHRPNSLKQFFNWNSLFPGDSRLWGFHKKTQSANLLWFTSYCRNRIYSGKIKGVLDYVHNQSPRVSEEVSWQLPEYSVVEKTKSNHFKFKEKFVNATWLLLLVEVFCSRVQATLGDFSNNLFLVPFLSCFS